MKRKLGILALLVITAGCFNDKADKLYPLQPTPVGDPCDTTNVTITYSGKIRTIMQNNCTAPGCHDAAAQSAGYDLSSYVGVQTAAANGKLLATIRHEASASPMPQGGTKLSDCTIGQIDKWVRTGALNN